MRQIFKAVSELRKISWMFLSNWPTVSRFDHLNVPVVDRTGKILLENHFSQNGFLKPLVLGPILGKGLEGENKRP